MLARGSCKSFALLRKNGGMKMRRFANSARVAGTRQSASARHRFAPCAVNSSVEARMKTSLDRFIDPANYHPDAVADAGRGEMADIPSSLLLIRLGIELHREDHAAANAAVERLEADNRGGYELFQLLTAKIVLALWSADETAILLALKSWLDARKRYPGNWSDDVLEAPELAPYVAKVNPAKLVPPKIKPRAITRADRALVKDLNAARKQAVTENLVYLRDLGVSDSITAIARAYDISFANHHLREVTLSASADWPDLVIAIDAEGAMLGSFIAH